MEGWSACGQSQVPAQLVDEQQGGDVANTTLDRNQAHQLPLEFLQHVTDVGVAKSGVEVESVTRSDDRSHSDSSIALAFGAIDRIRVGRVAHRPSAHFLTLQAEAGLPGRPAHNEGQPQRLAPVRRIEGVHLDVILWECLPASMKLCQNAGSIPNVEHRY